MSPLLLLLAACGSLNSIQKDGANDDTDVVVDSVDTPADDTDPAVDTSICEARELLDCDGFCVSSSFLGDGTCDDGDRANLDCDRYDRDGGDCVPVVPICGDNHQDLGEECDDGNTANLDGCSSSCQLEGCGDGVIQPGEACDDGNTLDDVACPADCGFCLDDALEDNDDRLSATTTVGIPLWSGERVCPTDNDWYSFTLQPGDRVVATATFVSAEGDLSLSLANPSGTTVASGTGGTDSESLSYTAEVAGDHALRVWLGADPGARGNDYDLQLDVLSCDVDAHEDDDSPASAWLATALPVSAGLHACSGDDDLTRIELTAGQRLVASAAFSEAEGDLRLTITDLVGGLLADGVRSTSHETAIWTATTTGPVLVQVVLQSDEGAEAGVGYDLTLEAASCVDDAREQDDTPAGLVPPAIPFLQAGLVACPSDPDHIALDLSAGGTLDVAALWDTSEGGLRVELLNPSNTVVATASGPAGDRALSYTPTAGGRYHLRATLDGEAGTLPGVSYELGILATQCPVDIYEENDARTSPAAITLPFSATGLGSCASDEDWYSFPVTAGDQVRVFADFVNAEGDIDIGLYDETGSSVASGSGTRDDETITTAAESSGTWTAKVRLYQDAGAVPGNTYGLEVGTTPCAIDAHEEDDLPGLSPWSGDVSGAWNACMGDPDHVDVPLATGDGVEVVLDWATGDGDLVVEVLDAAGAVVASDSFGQGHGTISFQARTAGTHSVRVRMTNDRGAVPGAPYTLSVSRTVCPVDSLEDDDDAANGTAITSPYSVTGLSACESDPDVFLIPAVVGTRIYAYADFSDALGDINLELASPTGNVVRSATGYSDDEELVYVATTNGTYALTVRNLYDAGVAGNDYGLTVSVTTCGADANEDDDNAVQATPTAPPYTASLTACDGDEDWFHVPVLVGDWVVATALYDSNEGDVDLALRDPLGSTVDYGTTITGGEELSWVVTRAGTHDLVADLQSDDGPLAGNVYDLDITVLSCPADPLEDDDDSANATDATAGLSRTDLVSCDDDDDWYLVTLAPGQSVTIDAYFSDPEGDVDLSLKDAGLSTVRSSTGTSDAEHITYTSAAGGTFYLRVYLSSDGGAVPGNPYDLGITVL